MIKYPANFKYFLLIGSVMIDLECRDCGYKFRRAKITPRCPYCSVADSVGLLKTAQDLVDDTIGESRRIDEEKSRRNL